MKGYILEDYSFNNKRLNACVKSGYLYLVSPQDLILLNDQ